jgi:PAS domain S-box-containing protein
LNARALFGPLIADAPVGLALVDSEFRYVFVNATLAGLNGRPVGDHFEATVADILPSDLWEQMRPGFERALTGEVLRSQEVVGLHPDGVTPRHLLASYYPVRADRRTVTGVGLVVNDISERKQAEALLAGQNDLLHGIVAGVSLSDTMDGLVRLIEAQLPGALGSVMVADVSSAPTGTPARLRLGAAPGLPMEYRKDLLRDGVAIAPDAGPCGIAAYLGEPVLSVDLAADFGEAEACPLLVDAGVSGCRCTPILGNGGETLGTFTLFFTGRAPEAESSRVLELVETASHLARIALERDRQELRRRMLLRDMLTSLTEGRLRLCLSDAELPERLTDIGIEPMPLSVESLQAFRWMVTGAAVDLGMSLERRFDLATAVGEASMNAVVHAGGGRGCVFADPATGRIQVWVRDAGRGIAEESLHRATLERGFTTAGTLGHGFWMILRTVDKVYLQTGDGGTIVVLEQGRESAEMDWFGLLGINERK